MCSAQARGGRETIEVAESHFLGIGANGGGTWQRGGSIDLDIWTPTCFLCYWLYYGGYCYSPGQNKHVQQTIDGRPELVVSIIRRWTSARLLAG